MCVGTESDVTCPTAHLGSDGHRIKKKYIVTAFTSVMPAGGKTRFVLVIGDGGERAERWCK